MINLAISVYDALRNTCDILHLCKLNYNVDQQDVHVNRIRTQIYKANDECNDFLIFN